MIDAKSEGKFKGGISELLSLSTNTYEKGSIANSIYIVLKIKFSTFNIHIRLTQSKFLDCPFNSIKYFKEISKYDKKHRNGYARVIKAIIIINKNA